jgi:hypothetical protein
MLKHLENMKNNGSRMNCSRMIKMLEQIGTPMKQRATPSTKSVGKAWRNIEFSI